MNVRRWGAVMVLLVFALTLGATSAVRAEPTQFTTGPTPVIWVMLTGGTLTVHTWDQPQVQIDGDAGIQWHYVPAERVATRLPSQVMLWSQTEQTRDGASLMLPAEAFVLPQLSGTEHDAVFGRGEGNATVTIPSGTALLVTNVARGNVAIDNYHDGVFVMHVHGGSATLDNVSGSGAAQVTNGPFRAENSQFTRLRVRTTRGNISLHDCTSQQIEATSLTGSIVYDDGSFQPGLARFETQRGNVALGIGGGNVQINAHSEQGKIVSDFAPGEANASISGNDGQVTVGGAGPVVTATSGSGAVILYRGSLANHPQFENRWPHLEDALKDQQDQRFTATHPPLRRTPLRRHVPHP